MWKEMIFFLAIPIIALMYFAFEPKITLLGIYPIEILIQIYKDMFLRVLIISLFTNYKKVGTTQILGAC